MSDFINDRAGRSTKVTARTSYPQPAITTEDDLARCSVCNEWDHAEWMREGVCEPCFLDAMPDLIDPIWDVCTLCGAPTDRGECPKHERSRER